MLQQQACGDLWRDLREGVRRTSALAPAVARRTFVLSVSGAAAGVNCKWEDDQPRSKMEMQLVWDALGWQDDTHWILQVPCVSSIRWSSALDKYGLIPPWQTTIVSSSPPPRDLLMSFVGSANTPFKKKLIEVCKALGQRVCGLFDADNGEFPFPNGEVEPRGTPEDARDRAVLAMLHLRRRSVFCLEPEGLSPGRKSNVDAILSGCIPVFLFERDNYERLLPQHFRWRKHASVWIDPKDITKGKVDLAAKLAPMNRSGAARSMQRAIAQHARSLVYSLDGGMRGDAVDVFVRSLARELNEAAGSSSPRCGEAIHEWRCQSKRST